MPRRAICALAVFALALLSGMTGAAAEKRVALVIGNAAYDNIRPQLANPGKDARDIGAALTASGFDTTVGVDVKRRELYQLIDAFGAKIAASPDTVGLFYYAGHGIQADGKNYLIPVDADLESDADLEADAVDAGKVLRAMDQARNRINIVILDACRDNPLPKGRSLARGLATMEASRGTFIGYAAAPGQTAQDGAQGQNGVFTGVLIKELAVPGLPVEEMFKKVIGGVEQRTGGKQVPWMESSLQGNFYFTAAAPAAPPPAVAAASPVAAPSAARSIGGGDERDALFWDSIKKSSDPADYQDFLAHFPNSEFSALAQRRLAALRAPPVAPPPAAPAPAPPAVTALTCGGNSDERVTRPVKSLYQAVNAKNIDLYAAQSTSDAVFRDLLTGVSRSKAEKIEDRRRQFAEWQAVKLTMEKVAITDRTATSATVSVTYSMFFRSQGYEFHSQPGVVERYAVVCDASGKWLIHENSDRTNEAH